MLYSYSNEQMRRADERTIESGTPQKSLMARAGRALADCVKAAAERLGVQDMLFVCGGGNNGGDGFVAAELLRREGYSPSVLCLAEKLSPACEEEMKNYHGELFCKAVRRRYLLVVDCVLGTGLSRAPEGSAKEGIEFILRNGGYVVSADIPSGLSSGGIAFYPCVKADETVCMGLMKNALLLESGSDYAGKVSVVDIGITSTEQGAEIWQEEEVSAFFPKRKNHVNKGNFGTASILSQRERLSGAIFLSAGACLKTGVGYTKLFVTERAYGDAVGKIPACMLKLLPENGDEVLRSSAITLGMGEGVSEELYSLIRAILCAYEGTLILDADALNTLAKYGVEVLRQKKCKVILTPHIKEFSRLSGRSVEMVKSDMVGTAKEFARDMGVTLLLKSNASVITDGERVAINVVGSPALAKGGSGDVLSGILAGTVARGVAPFEACAVSAYLLGISGVLAAEEMGEYSPDGTDIISYLPKAILSLTQANNRTV